MRKSFLSLLCLILSLPSWAQLTAEQRAAGEKAAASIINRFTDGKVDVAVELSLTPTDKGCDKYEYSAEGNTVTVKASSAVAACRAFYDWTKSKQAGMMTWSGKRFDRPADLSTAAKTLTSQYRDHQYFNVVTYGYTMPYWDEDRWDKELDWMALHGIDMPLFLLAQEIIYRRVFLSMGLTAKDIDAWEVGPAHLPWFRMGNLSGNTFDGPLGDEWNNRQLEIAHHVLNRMDSLGMKPICPAFGGFVPGNFATRVKGTSTERVGWGWCIDGTHQNYRLSPTTDAFVEVGSRFIKEWEKEFGVRKYYLSDSFNEMAIPSAADLPAYGQNIWKSISEGSANPDVVWVTQGWTFNYQQGSWGLAKFQALTSMVPDDQFMVLYMSPEYGGYNNKSWETYNSFDGKDWTYTLLPNMGGKNTLTGKLNDYAQTFLNSLNNSTKKSSLTGYGMTPEGVENNEILYELITDGGWVASKKTINLDSWLKQYANSRYGGYTAEQQAFHQALRNSVYNYFTDHPRFGWQSDGGLGSGSASQNDAFYSGVETLFSQLDAIRQQGSPLAQADMVEAVAMYCGGKVEKLNNRIQGYVTAGNTLMADSLLGVLDHLMISMDRALTCHPVYNLKRWEDLAQKGYSGSAKRNAQNARRILTVWFGKDHSSAEPVQDYAARVWAGLVRDYYRPRLLHKWNAALGRKAWDGKANQYKWEEAWVESAPTLSDYEAVPADTLGFLAEVLAEAKAACEINFETLDSYKVSTDRENHWYAFRCAFDDNNTRVLTAAGDNARLDAQVDTKSETQIWRILQNADGTLVLESRNGDYIAVNGSNPYTFRAPVKADVKIDWANNDKNWLAILPTAAPSSSPALHFNKPADLVKLYGYKSGTEYYAGSHWTIENVAPAMVLEARAADYARYIKRLSGYTQDELFGKAGYPTSKQALQEAIAQLEREAQNIDHKSFDTFLAQWAELWDGLIVKASNPTADRLIALIAQAHGAIDGTTDDTAVGYFNPEATATLQEAILIAEQEAAANPSATVAQGAYDRLQQALVTYFLSSSTTLHGPKASNTKTQYGYRFSTPNREARYATSQGSGKGLIGVQNASDAKSVWYFYERTDGSYDIRNKADKSYIAPTAGNDTQLKTTATKPSAGWRLKGSDAEGCFRIYSGTAQMMNQTGFADGSGKKIYNWGAAVSDATSSADAGCQYAFEFVSTDGEVDAINAAVLLPSFSEPHYNLQGQPAGSHKAGRDIYIQRRKKVIR